MKATKFVAVERSLVDLLGREYFESVCAAHAFLCGRTIGKFISVAEEKISFYPDLMQEEMASLLEWVGKQVIEQPLKKTIPGAGSAKFCEVTKTSAAPLSARGYFRIGENGCLYLVSKSEHYHAPLGHSFPGYELVSYARNLGIPNATHNNTRGYITRLLEEELIRTANGLERGDCTGLDAVLNRKDDLSVLNRVLNLETGSLAVEAALKMVLARFYKMQSEISMPKYQGRTPIILVMGNDDGDLQANYHGTTILTQMMRGMWPNLYKDVEKAELWKVVAIRPNCREDLDRVFAEYEKGKTKIAGFFHEIIMMNYGGRRLTPEFLRHAYDLCEQHDVPTIVDEIQTCMWSSKLYMFREYGLKPTFVSIGKGFPGGEYPASRILFSAAMDVMPQFGALVTNGQEELASLSYLIAMEWAQANAAITEELGEYCEDRMRTFVAKYPQEIKGTDGWRHMTSICFSDLEMAKTFTTNLVDHGLDISVQTYKAKCPSVVLIKLPLIADCAMIDFTVNQMERVMKSLI